MCSNLPKQKHLQDGFLFLFTFILLLVIQTVLLKQVELQKLTHNVFLSIL